MRVIASHRLKNETEDQATLRVMTTVAKNGPAFEQIILPGSVQAWHEAPINARTSGYIKSWNTDIGTVVKEGDLLATIDTPEVDAQYRQAQADLDTAKANSALAQITAARWQSLVGRGEVSKQDSDEKTSDAVAKKALVAAAQANVDRLAQIESFKEVRAPFAGTITARGIDIGSLINAGNNGTTQELFRIAETDKLRVYVEVPERYINFLHNDLIAELHFSEFPDHDFSAKVTQIANALAPSSRTMRVQLLLDNAEGHIKPGSYAEVHLKLPVHASNARIPVNTLIFRAPGLQVAVVNETSHAVLRSVKISVDLGSEVEIDKGIKPGEKIIINPPDSLVDGEAVIAVVPDKKT
jgi:RND family efflux transporter MFP subunit